MTIEIPEIFPPLTAAALDRYLNHHIRPGDFLTAVLCNDLKQTIAYADDENVRLIAKYVQFLYCHAPAGSWGSVEKFESWLAKRELS